MTEEWHNKFGVFKNGFGQFEYILPENRNFNLKVVFIGDYIFLRQAGSGGLHTDDVISLWNKDLVKREITVNEWKDLYFLLTGEHLTITQKI